jgi:hypothetical protein
MGTSSFVSKEYGFSTELMLYDLVFWGSHRRKNDDKNIGLWLLDWVLARVCDPGVYKGVDLKALTFSDTPCPRKKKDGHCVCVGKYFKAFQVAGDLWQSKSWSAKLAFVMFQLDKSCPESRSCPILLTELRSRLSTIAEEAWERRADWSGKAEDYLKSSLCMPDRDGDVKRRKVDPNLKIFMVSAEQQGRALGGTLESVLACNGLGPRDGIRFRNQEISALRAEGLIRNKDITTASIIFDGWRGGNPAKERLLAVCSNLANPSEINTVLIPKEPKTSAGCVPKWIRCGVVRCSVVKYGVV